MAAQQQAQPQQRREEVTFPPNVAVTLSLKYAQGKMVSGQFGERVMLTTCDNRVCFLNPEVAGQIEAAGVNVREPFTITRRTSGRKGDPETWEVARIQPAAGEQQNGTYVLPRDPTAAPADAAALPAPKPPAIAQHASSMTLAQAAKFAVDAYAEVLAHGLSAYGGKVKPDEIQRIFTTVYIQRQGAA